MNTILGFMLVVSFVCTLFIGVSVYVLLGFKRDLEITNKRLLYIEDNINDICQPKLDNELDALLELSLAIDLLRKNISFMDDTLKQYYIRLNEKVDHEDLDDIHNHIQECLNRVSYTLKREIITSHSELSERIRELSENVMVE